MPGAICKCGDRKHQSGGDKVTNLKAGMIIAVRETWQVNDSIECVARKSEFLCEDRMCNLYIHGLPSTIQQHHSEIVGARQIVLEDCTDRLNR